jgi:hypothetical protein
MTKPRAFWESPDCYNLLTFLGNLDGMDRVCGFFRSGSQELPAKPQACGCEPPKAAINARRRFSNNSSPRMAHRAMATIAPSPATPSAISVVAMGRRPLRDYAPHLFLSFRFRPVCHALWDCRKSRTLKVSLAEPGDLVLDIKSFVSILLEKFIDDLGASLF